MYLPFPRYTGRDSQAGERPRRGAPSVGRDEKDFLPGGVECTYKVAMVPRGCLSDDKRKRSPPLFTYLPFQMRACVPAPVATIRTGEAARPAVSFFSLPTKSSLYLTLAKISSRTLSLNGYHLVVVFAVTFQSRLLQHFAGCTGERVCFGFVSHGAIPCPLRIMAFSFQPLSNRTITPYIPPGWFSCCRILLTLECLVVRQSHLSQGVSVGQVPAVSHSSTRGDYPPM